MLAETAIKEKRREKVILKGVGATTKKFEGVVHCNESVTLKVLKYVATSSALLCKGMVNTKRIFIKNDKVWVLCPNQSPREQVIVIIKKFIGTKEMVFSRKLEDIVPSLSLVEVSDETFNVTKRAYTKADGTWCYCITPIPGCDVWVDENLVSVKRDMLTDNPQNVLNNTKQFFTTRRWNENDISEFFMDGWNEDDLTNL